MSRESDGMVLREDRPGAPAAARYRPELPETRSRRSPRAASPPGGTSDDVMGNFHQQVYGKTGTAQYNDPRLTTPGTPASCRRLRPASRSRSSSWVEKGGFGDIGAAPVARQICRSGFTGRPGSDREVDDAVSAGVTRFDRPEEAATSDARPLLAFDPLLMLAALGLVGCSLLTLHGRGEPLYYYQHQAMFAGAGLVAVRW